MALGSNNQYNSGSNNGIRTFNGIKTSGFRIGVTQKAEELNNNNTINLGTTVNFVRAADSGKDRTGSSNNRVNQRSNEARLNERIPDIYGKVLSVPDLLTKTYILIENDASFYINYFCIGRGSFTVSEVEEAGSTILSLGGEYDVYGPNTSPITSLGTINSVFVPAIDSVGVKTNDLSACLVLRPPNAILVTDALEGDTEGFVFERGPYVFENCNGVLVNLVASDGTKSPGDYVNPAITVTVYCRAVNEANVPFGSTYSSAYTYIGFTNDALATSRYRSFNYDFPISGRVQVVVKRTSNYAGHETASFHRRVYLSGIYGKVNMLGKTQFGDVTTIRTKIPTDNDLLANIGTSSFKFTTTSRSSFSPKVTCLAQRKIDGVATSEFSKIAKSICLDEKIGNRQLAEIDSASLTALQSSITSYFGTSKACEFNYTFDDEAISFEETLGSVCAAAFVTVYRDGPTIKFKFEGPNTASRLLFNHRNKIPGSEVRSITFGYLGEKDGVRYEYTDITDGAKLYYILPIDESAVNVESETTVGITNKLQAYFHAHRRMNRQLYQNTVVEFEATQEANVLNIKDKIVVADNTRTQTYDGEIVSKSGLTLTLSQPYTFEVGVDATIFIQNVTGEVEAIGISEVVGQPYKVLLDSDTSEDLSLANSAFTKATYEIVPDTSLRREAFLVEEKEQIDKMTVRLLAVNYDVRYYNGDNDYLTGVVDINGN